MQMNRIQFQKGLSLSKFLEQFGTESQCEAALERTRWPDGFRCPCCDCADYYPLHVGIHPAYQCCNCRLQTSLIAGTLFQSTHLPLTVWFLAIYLISEAKTGISSLALKRQLGVSYPTAWLIQHKLMQAMKERDSDYLLVGQVLIDDAYLGGELAGGKCGRGSENKVPFVAAVSLDSDRHPIYAKTAPVPAFTRQAVADWAAPRIDSGCTVTSDGLACFAGVTDIGCQHQPIVVGNRKPKDLLQFIWLNIVLGNLKTGLSGTYHAFNFAKYGLRYLAAFVYRFNRRFNLDKLPMQLLFAAVTSRPHPERLTRSVGVYCQ
jgi:hypothetical protein